MSERDSKVMDLPTAVARSCHDGDVVCLAGLAHLIPFAAAHEIVRQRLRELTVVRSSADLMVEQMLIGGCVTRLIFGWMGNPGLGLADLLRRRVQAGTLAIEEHTHAMLMARLYAGARNLPFYPLPARPQTDLVDHMQSAIEVTHPRLPGPTFAVLPLQPDVTFIHAQYVDPQGNVSVSGLTGEILDSGIAAERVVVTAEHIVASGDLPSAPGQVLPLASRTVAVAEAKWGAHPSYAEGEYRRDDAFYAWWHTHGKDHETLEEWVDENILGFQTHDDYVRESIGSERRQALLYAPSLSDDEPVSEERMDVGGRT